MTIIIRKRTIKLAFAMVMVFGITLGLYNFALHPNTTNWEKERILLRQVKTDEKILALTFDDGPDSKHTKALLEVLNKHNASATFFVVGTRAQKHPELLKEMSMAGHEIGNHSYSHADFNNKDDKFILNEIQQTNELIFELSGQKPIMFRPPGGYLSYAMVDLIRQEKMIIAYWTWQQDSKDWRNGISSSNIARHVINNAAPGQIIILHDGAANGMETVKAVDKIIPELQDKGYRFLTMSKLAQFQKK